jgi:ribose 5-phosphate isomerase A
MAQRDLAGLKRAAAAEALEFVTPKMKLGLGTGSTAEFFLDFLGLKVKAGLDIIGVPTSERTAEKARALGIRLGSLDELAPLDLTIDGADEADRNLDLIKGAGGALLKEKIVACASKQMIVIVDETKHVEKLGAFALPVEVAFFGHRTTGGALQHLHETLGYTDATAVLRMKDNVPFRTDSGNVIYDCAFGEIDDPEELAAALSEVPGVVAHGLFLNLCDMLIVAHPGKVEIIERE